MSNVPIALIVVGLPLIVFTLMVLSLLYVPKGKNESVSEWWRSLNSGDWRIKK